METKVYPYEECEKCDKREKISNNLSACPSMKIRCVKQLEEHDKQIRDKAIDSFVNECVRFEDLTFNKAQIERIKRVAEQLKGEYIWGYLE